MHWQGSNLMMPEKVDTLVELLGTLTGLKDLKILYLVRFSLQELCFRFQLLRSIFPLQCLLRFQLILMDAQQNPKLIYGSDTIADVTYFGVTHILAGQQCYWIKRGNQSGPSTGEADWLGALEPGETNSEGWGGEGGDWCEFIEPVIS